MPAPTATAVIDDLNRADGPIHAGNTTWITTNLSDGSATQLRVVGNQLGGVGNCATVADYGPDIDWIVDVPVLFTAGSAIWLFARLKDVGQAGAFDGYVLKVAQPGAWSIERWDNGSPQSLAAGTGALAAGDRVWLNIMGSVITGYQRTPGGSWVQRVQATDTTYPAAGRLGVEKDDSTSRLDNLSGGTVNPPPPPAPQTLVELAVAKGDMLIADATGHWSRVAYPTTVKPGKQVLAVGLDGPEWAELAAPTVAVKAPPPAPAPASGGVAYDNRALFSTASFWRKPVPAAPPLHASSDTWRRNICDQMQVNPNATGPFGEPIQGTNASKTWFNVAGNNYTVYVVEPDGIGVTYEAFANRYVVHGNYSPFQRDLHDETMRGVPIPQGAYPQTPPGTDHTLIVYCPRLDKMWEFISAYRVGEIAPRWPDQAIWEGNGTIEAKPYQWTYSHGGVMLNVSQSQGVYTDRVVNGKQVEYASWGGAATSFPYIAGLITPEESKAVLDGTAADFGHVLKGAFGNAWTQFLAPAQRGDGGMDATWFPEGGRLYLDITDFTPYANERVLTRALIKTLARYGMVNADKTGWGVDAPNWRNPDTYPTQPYGPEFYPAFFGTANAWSPTEIMQRVPWHKAKVLDPSVNS